MRFPYRVYPVPRPVVSLGGRPARPQPVIPVTVVGPGGAAAREGLLDTGSDDTIFPERVAALIGLDLTGAPVRTAAGVGLVPAAVRFAEVTLRLTDGVEFREWRAWAGFTPARLNRPLLGFAGFLQFFTAAFDGQREQVELIVNGLHPGT